MSIYNKHRLIAELGMAFDTERMAVEQNVVVDVDVDVMYEHVRKILEQRFPNEGFDQVDQYVAEVIRRCVVTRCQDVFQPTKNGGPLIIRTYAKNKEETPWALVRLPAPKGRSADDGVRAFQPFYDAIAEAIF